MAAGQKLYPRGTVKKIVKAHSNCNLTKNADVLIFLDYMMFMEKCAFSPRVFRHIGIQMSEILMRGANSRLIKEAAIETRKKGERNLTPASVNKVVADSLLKFKG
ncbi:hypothetical protein BROUX41_001037 [Berkeleyomyces rouxiae]